ncbi:hypothetical protein PV328_004608 [Microctonus aethiopoides]|uniref:Uncharacterized protein n=1 Tax=Microctonus aethiopoides TaxID=144406 RepID=A0AA39KLQ6_9HYME|nr:hypothetical protein PV328_004608 [Microctonus aethiopoides]
MPQMIRRISLLDLKHKKAARVIKPHCAYNTISYARARMLPRIPDTLNELVGIIDKFPENLITSYHGYFRSCDGKIGLVFTTDEPITWSYRQKRSLTVFA